MLKVAGLIILIISGTLKGISISEKYLKRVRFLHSYINFLIHLKSEISYTGKTLFEILKNYSCPKPLETRLNKCLTDSKFNSFENSWENAFSDISYETGITNDETAMIINFGKELGNEKDYCACPSLQYSRTDKSHKSLYKFVSNKN